jgi:hypothetical protein
VAIRSRDNPPSAFFVIFPSLPLTSVIIAAEILQIYSDGGHGKDYWRYCFPALSESSMLGASKLALTPVLGSAGAMIAYFASAINLISYCPPEMAGVAGAWTQVLAQVGGAVALAVQAGLQTNLVDWRESSGRACWSRLPGWLL